MRYRYYDEFEPEQVAEPLGFYEFDIDEDEELFYLELALGKAEESDYLATVA